MAGLLGPLELELLLPQPPSCLIERHAEGPEGAYLENERRRCACGHRVRAEPARGGSAVLGRARCAGLAGSNSKLRDGRKKKAQRHAGIQYPDLSHWSHLDEFDTDHVT
jgi:hypothetical protein